MTDKPGTVLNHGTVKRRNGTLRQYRIVRCRCGGVVHCINGWSNVCGAATCDAEFNGSGQLLAPRRFWGDETGETFS